MKNSKMFIAGLALLLPAFAAAQVQSSATNNTVPPAAVTAAPAVPAAAVAATPAPASEAPAAVTPPPAAPAAVTPPPAAPAAAPAAVSVMPAPAPEAAPSVVPAVAPAAPSAKEHMGNREPKDHPCMADMEKFCKNINGGQVEKMTCLKEHEADLSAACKARMAKGKEEGKVEHPCMADMEKFCKDVKGGPGEKMKCLKEHQADLSDACKAKMAKGKDEAKGKDQAKGDHPCMADMEKFCKDVQGGHGEKMKCLKAHEADLSAACKDRMAKGMEEGKREHGKKEWKKDAPKPEETK